MALEIKKDELSTYPQKLLLLLKKELNNERDRKRY